MCRSHADGGRLCPSQTDPVRIANRNARRRAAYAKRKKGNLVSSEKREFKPFSEHSLAQHFSDGNKPFYSTGDVEKNDDLGIEVKTFAGDLSRTGYFAYTQISGKIDYTKLDDNSYKAFGFEDPEEVRDPNTDEDALVSLSRAEIEDFAISEKKAIRTYTGGSYGLINKALYNTDPEETDLFDLGDEEDKPYYDDEPGEDKLFSPKLGLGPTIQAERTPKFIREFTEKMDGAISKGPAQQRIVYRGMKYGHNAFKQSSNQEMTERVSAFAEENYPVGQELKFDGYQSTSYSPAQAADYAGDCGIVFEIRAATGVNVAGNSAYKGEQEVVLGRDTRYMVVGVHKKINYSYMTQTLEYEDEDDLEGMMVDSLDTKSGVTIVQLVEITEDGSIRDETNYTPPAPLNQAQIAHMEF